MATIRGCPHRYEQIQDEDEWSWTLYPPKFTFDGEEAGLYLIEHETVSQLDIRIDGGLLQASGVADVGGEEYLLTIQWRFPRQPQA
ncbi:MAG: hypothetical protein U0931_38350 [Vulcanimicrobiota bacterium]